MLTITVHSEEAWDEANEEFVTQDIAQLELEHSLVSLSKWESFYEKPFLGGGEKTDEETLHYIKDMALNLDFPPEVFFKLSQKNIDDINDYINTKATATWFVDEHSNPHNSEVITSELIYYWLIAFNIPFECQFWHLNRLFTLIRLCNVKNNKPKKMSRSDMLARRAKLNAERRARMGSSG